MATQEQEQQARSTLEQTLAELSKIRPESLARTGELGAEVNFEPGLPIFKRTLTLFSDLASCSLEDIPFETLQNLNNVAGQVLSSMKAIQSFTIKQNAQNPVGARDTLINQVRDQWQNHWSQVAPTLTFAAKRSTDLTALERETRGTVSLTKQLFTDAKTEKEKMLAEMQGALEKVRQAAAEAGVAQHAVHFKQEADQFRWQAWWWLGGAITFGVGVVAFAVWLVPHLKEYANQPAGAWAPVLVSRVVIISILYSGLTWCGRHYSAARHNYVVNRHRQNALSTFETFVKAAGDEQTKNAVLLQSTQSIFSAQPTGYSNTEPDAASPNQVIEIVRSLPTMKAS